MRHDYADCAGRAADTPLFVAIETSALTHDYTTGQLAAAAWAERIADKVAGMPLGEAGRKAFTAYAAMPGGQEVVDAIKAALDTPRNSVRWTIESLGGGWVAEECLAIALNACLFANGLDGETDASTAFKYGIECAACHDGDSDSTAAVAGNMPGLMFPNPALDFDKRYIPLAESLFQPLLGVHRIIRSDGIDASLPTGLLFPW
ncbi:MAG: ADP-ribosylglycohydrolase family protein [Pseudorhodobacter sp.]